MTWNNNGHMTDRASDDFAWTALGQLRQAAISGQTARDYTYDAFGRRVKIVVGSQTNRFLYNEWHMIGEYDSTAGHWLWQEGPWNEGEQMLEHIARDTNDLDSDSNVTEYRQYAIHEDLQDTLWGLTDTAAAVVERYFYTDPYGKSETKNGAGTNIGAFASNVFHRKRLHGGFVEAVSGLYDYRERWNDCISAAWLIRDGVFQERGNQYASLGINPLTFTDPYGLTPMVSSEKCNACFKASETCPALSCWQTLVNSWAPAPTENIFLWSFIRSLSRMRVECNCSGCIGAKGGYRAGRNPKPGPGINNQIKIFYSENLGPEWEQSKATMERLGYPPPPNYPNSPDDECCPCGDVMDVLLHEASHSWCRMAGGKDCQDPDGGEYDPIGDQLHDCINSGSADSAACKEATKELRSDYLGS